MREIVTNKEVMDLKGWTIPKGTKLHVMKEGPVHPTEGHKVLLCRVDNGTDNLSLMPETIVHNTEVESEKNV